MLEFINMYGINIKFVFELIMAELIFIRLLEKRKYFGLRLVLAVILLFTAASQMDLAVPIMAITKFVVEFILVMISSYTLCQIKFSNALYYTVCAYATQHFTSSFYDILERSFSIQYLEIFVYIATYGIIYLLVYFAFARKITERGNNQRKLSESIKIGGIILFIVLFLRIYVLNYAGDNVPVLNLFYIYSMICCFFVMWVQIISYKETKVESELFAQQEIFQMQKEQYELAKENIEIINRKCHDMKYLIRMLRLEQDNAKKEESIQELEDAIDIYKTNIKTGNEVLDMVLMEKGLLCERSGIHWTCMADGKKMDFMKPVDLYTMAGNALDNAIENVNRITTKEKRVIAVHLFSRKNMVFFQVENFYDGKLEHDEKQNLKSLKADKTEHGFGLKSIRYVAEKYDGTMSVSIEKDIFILCVMIPVII